MWITDENFNLLESLCSGGQQIEEVVIELKVDYNALTAKQKKKLPTLKGDFKVIINERSRAPPKLKKKVVKERNFQKKDIMDLVKIVYKEHDRDKVLATLIDYDISPVVLSIWLLRIFVQDRYAFEILVEAEKYVYNKDAYYTIISSFDPTRATLKFRFPKKLREA